MSPAKAKGAFLRHPLLWSLAAGQALGFLGCLIAALGRASSLSGLFAVSAGVGLFLVWPLLLTLLNLAFLIRRAKGAAARRAGQAVEGATLAAGALFTALLLSVSEIRFADWPVPLQNTQRHTPVASWGVPTVAVLAAVGLLGYLLLRLVPLPKLPPLAAVLAMAALYLGCGVCLLWIAQVFTARYWLLALFPANCLLIAAKAVRDLVAQWREQCPRREAAARYQTRPLLGQMAALLENAANWPWLAGLLMWPLLGVLVGLLALFGQAPDAVLRAWSETSDWNLSQQVSPPTVIYDEHYLCTVAAGGHRRLVKPLRPGCRHGYRVTVNRQLCVANAFEQLLEERTPRFHRLVRGLYDRLGYPVARHIRSPYLADAVYLLMKPAEWLFLTALYLFDPLPENRIAVQYPHRPLPGGYRR